MRHLVVTLTLLAGLGLPLTAQTVPPQDPAAPATGNEPSDAVDDDADTMDDGDGPDAAADGDEQPNRLAENPPTHSRRAQPVLAAERFDLAKSLFDGLGLLRGLRLDLKTFEGQNDEASLGVGFDFAKSERWESDDGASAWELEFVAKGNVAFEDATNPDDFLEAKGKLHWNTGSRLREDGVTFVNPTDAAIRDELTDPETTTERRAELVEQLQRARNGRRLYWDLDVDVNAGIESNQAFTARNYTFGAEVALDLKQYDDRSLWSRLNVFDYPFALTRHLSGMSDGLTPRGSALPTIVLGADWVEPTGSDPRTLAGDGSGFVRLRLEATVKAPFWQLAKEGGKASILYAELNYRGFYDPGASAAIEAASLDFIDYFSAAITHESGLFASYRTGELPFDVTETSAFEVGWKFEL